MRELAAFLYDVWNNPGMGWGNGDKRGNCWNHFLKQYKEVGCHAQVEEWAVNRVVDRM